MNWMTFWRYLSNSEKGPKNSGLNGDSDSDVSDAGAVLYQLSYQANLELVVMLFDYKPFVDRYRYKTLTGFESPLRPEFSGFSRSCLRSAEKKTPKIFYIHSNSQFNTWHSCIIIIYVWDKLPFDRTKQHLPSNSANKLSVVLHDHVRVWSWHTLRLNPTACKNSIAARWRPQQ